MPEEVKGVPPGVTKADLDPAQGMDGPKAPIVDENNPPERVAAEAAKKAEEAAAKKAKEGDDEEHGTPAKKEDEPKKEDAPEGKEGEENKEDTPEPVEWVTYNHPGADGAVELMKDAGVTIETASQIFDKFAKSNKIEDVDTALLEKTIGASKAALVMAGLRQFHTEVISKNLEKFALLHEGIGGEQNLAKIKAWVDAKEGKGDATFDATVSQIRQMLEIGGIATKTAAAELAALYEADKGNSSLNRKLVTGDKSASTQPSETPLNKHEYLKLIKAEEEKLNPDPEVLAQIRRRRALGREHGI